MFENVKQIVKLRSGSIKFKIHFKQLAIPFKIFSDFESILNGDKNNDKNNNGSYTKNYQSHIPCSFAYKIVCTDDKFSKPAVLFRGKMQSIELLKQSLKKIIIVKYGKKVF